MLLKRDKEDNKTTKGQSPKEFVQEENNRILDRLHSEIKRLQQKCSDLQFALTSSQTAVKAEQQLKVQLQTAQQLNEAQTLELKSIKDELLMSKEKFQELDQQIKWKELDFKNQIESKDAKIDQLQRRLSLQNEVGRLQNECKKLYDDNKESCTEKMEDVVRRAKIPERRKSTGTGNKTIGEKEECRKPRSAISRSIQNPVSTRSKVFRHNLQNDGRNRSGTSDNHLEQSVLPNNYKANVATLPPISFSAKSSRSRRFNEPDSLSSSSVEISVLANVSSGDSTTDLTVKNSHDNPCCSNNHTLVRADGPKDSFA